MTLTPEQKAEGWIAWSGGECPIRDDRTVVETKWDCDHQGQSAEYANPRLWAHDLDAPNIIAYRIIEAHGADAEPARPTPYPADYSELVWDADGWSQTIIVDGVRPEWLRDDDWCFSGSDDYTFAGRAWGEHLAIRVRRRKPKRETVQCRLLFTNGSPLNDQRRGTIDLIDGEPDYSTFKTGGAL